MCRNRQPIREKERQMSESIVIDDNTSASDLRKLYEKMKGERDAALQRATTLESEKRSTTVAELLSAKGVQGAAKAAKFYPADGAVDEASVVSWIEENKDFLKVGDPKSPASPTAPSSTSTPPAPAGAVPDPNDLAAQLVALATAAGAANEPFGMSNPQGAPTLDIDRMNQIMEQMRTAPRTAEGYAQLVQSGIFPADYSGM